jgi:hypothetical protein
VAAGVPVGLALGVGIGGATAATGAGLGEMAADVAAGDGSPGSQAAPSRTTARTATRVRASDGCARLAMVGSAVCPETPPSAADEDRRTSPRPSSYSA